MLLAATQVTGRKGKKTSLFTGYDRVIANIVDRHVERENAKAV